MPSRNTYSLTWVSLTLDVGYLFKAASAKHKHPPPATQSPGGDSMHGNHQMVNTKIKFIIFFAAKGGEALYIQQKQDQELTVAQIMNSSLPNSDLY